jgi:ribosomal protein S21
MSVSLRPGESFEELLRRHKRAMEAGGVLRDFRKQQRFKPAHEERRDKIRAAKRRRERARRERR